MHLKEELQVEYKDKLKKDLKDVKPTLSGARKWLTRGSLQQLYK